MVLTPPPPRGGTGIQLNFHRRALLPCALPISVQAEVANSFSIRSTDWSRQSPTKCSSRHSPEIAWIHPPQIHLTANLLEFDGSRLEGVQSFEIRWSPQIQRTVGEELPSIVAFIDNITFHPVPEPSSLALLASGVVAIVIAQRRMM